MPLADCMRSSVPSTSSLSPGIASNSLENFLTQASASAPPFSTFRPSSLPNALLKPDNKPYILPTLSDGPFTEDFQLVLDSGIKDLPKSRNINFLPDDSDWNKKFTRVPSKGEPIGIFPYRFPKSTEQESTPPQASKGLFPRLSDPYLTYLLTSSRGPSSGHSDRSFHKTETITREDLKTSSSSDDLLKNSSFHQSPTLDCKLICGLPFYPSSTSGSLLVQREPTDPQRKFSLDLPLTGRRVPFCSSSTLNPFEHFGESGIIPSKEILHEEQSLSRSSRRTVSSFEQLPHSPLLPSSSGKRAYSLETSYLRRPSSTPLKPSEHNNEIHRRGGKQKMTNCGGSNSDNNISNSATTSETIMYLGSKAQLSRKYGSGQDTVPNEIRESEMYQKFQNWAIKNYGDSGKTKTVTRNKYQRIMRILTGEEQFTAENSKFRFWVKAKGFRVSAKEEGVESDAKILLVPSKHTADEPADGGKTFKKVAVVEDFFDIIYSVHVEMDGRGGKHAGQKRTYRAIAEMYSFLPREAVTRFLMSCTDCQKRMHLSMESSNNSSSPEDRNDHLAQDDCEMSEAPPIIDYNVPITQTYLNHMRNNSKDLSYDASDHDDESVLSDSVMSREASPSPRESAESKEEREGSPVSLNNNKESTLEEAKDMTSARRSSPQPMETENRVTDSPIEDTPSRKASPIPGKVAEAKGHPERKRRASSESGDSALTKTSEGKDDDDDDENDDDEKMPVGQDIDPERLKAFNMFVRLFVDENLDRMVPISKQPKDKIQAILEACDRQFPEFHERSRKRIRTYLKSCRRMRRSKEHNGWEPLRPTPPHLTSAAAESLLATACENESQNAKRMRLGLEPLPASAMVSHNPIVMSQTPPTTQPSSQQQQPQQQPQQTAVTQTPSQPSSLSSPRSINCSVPTAADFLRHQPPPPAFRPAPEFNPSFFTNGHGAALFRPGFPNYQHPAHHHPTVLPHTPISANTTTNGEFGPTDLSMKKSSNKGQLSPSEVTAIKQLIAGYRESAAFLYRSADELEQLLLQQN